MTLFQSRTLIRPRIYIARKIKKSKYIVAVSDPNHMWGTSIANIGSFVMFFWHPIRIFEILIWSILSSFELRLRVSLSGNGYLTMISRVRNVNSKPFSFSFAYHTYYSVSDIRSVTKCDLHNIPLTSKIRMLNKR